MDFDDLEHFSFFSGVRNHIFKWSDSQGCAQGIRSLGFRSRCPNKEADALGLNKDGRSCRGVPPCFRPVDNAKRRGLKAMPKRQKRLSIRKPQGEIKNV